MAHDDHSDDGGGQSGPAGASWKPRVLRLLSEGRLAPRGEGVDYELLARLIDRIGADPEQGQRLDALSDDRLLEAIQRMLGELASGSRSR